MKLNAHLALSQLKKNPTRSMWTIIGIVLSAASVTAIYSFAVSGNSMLEQHMGENFHGDPFVAALNGIAFVMSIVVASFTVCVISNAFRVSAADRIAQFGILKSVGAARQDIRSTVMYEAVLLSALGIPLGIALGFSLNFFGIQFVNHHLQSFGVEGLVLYFEPAWQAAALSAFVSSAAIFLSAYLPASRAAKIPAITAIRGNDTDMTLLKATKTRERTNSTGHAGRIGRSDKAIRTIFGIEAVLAAKTLRRNRRNFRTTTLSLALSIVLIVTASSFSSMLETATDVAWAMTDADLLISIHAQQQDPMAPVSSLSQIDMQTLDALTNRFRAYLAANASDGGSGGEVLGIGSERFLHYTLLPNDLLSSEGEERFAHFEEMSPTGGDSDYSLVPLNLISLDEQSYAEFTADVGVPQDSNVLIFSVIEVVEQGQRLEFMPLNSVPDELSVQIIDPAVELTPDTLALPIAASKRAENLCPEIRKMTSTHAINIIVPLQHSSNYTWVISTDDVSGFMDYASDVPEVLQAAYPELSFSVQIANMQAERSAQSSLRHIIMALVYSFVAMLVLIGTTNVISTISTSVRLRSREFAVLRSVGTDERGLTRMLNFESVFSSLRALCIGLPLGMLASYLMHQAVIEAVAISYQAPLIAMAVCAGGIVVLSWVVMQVSSRRLRESNIIESIRKACS